MSLNLQVTDMLVFDACSYLDIYRFPLAISKRLFDYIIDYKNLLWIPHQVKKEFLTHKKSVSIIGKYEKFFQNISGQVQISKNQIIEFLKGYFKAQNLNISKISSEMDIKFNEIDELLKTMVFSVEEEKKEYKDYILNTVNPEMNNLFQSEQVGKGFSTPELVSILREGEVRYKYKIPPGFEDEDKTGQNKFGDLLTWKQLLKEARNQKYNRIFYVTSDEKLDWFENGTTEPRQELIDEFHYEISNKEICIIPMSEFIKLIKDGEQTDRELVLNLRKNVLLNQICDNVINDMLDDYINKENLNILNAYAPSQIPSGIFLSTLQTERFNLKNSYVSIIDNSIVYELQLDVAISADAEQEDIECGLMLFEGVVRVILRRELNENESDFLARAKSDYEVANLNMINCQYFDYEDNAWRSEAAEAMEDYYQH